MKIVDSYGNEMGYQDGSDYVIKDSSGSRLGWINSLNDIINTYGTKVGEIRSNGVFNVYGSRVGDVNGDNIISLLVTQEEPIPHSGGSSSSSEEGGCLAFIIGVILLGLWKALKSYVTGPFVEFSYLKETATRKEWWKTWIRSILLSLLFASLFGSLFMSLSVGYVPAIILIICLVFGSLQIIAVSIRRMHDIGKNGWWSIIPFVGFVMCGFFPGKIDGNKYK
jgi:uncharacterized membrane protein YhaH (DUF805 family)